jgi:hypothetical protein
MIWLRSSLDIIEQILKALQREVLPCNTPTIGSLNLNHNMEFRKIQGTIWADNLIRQLTFIRNRINDLTERQRTSEAMVQPLLLYDR